MGTTVWKPQLSLLDRDGIKTLHEAATAILERTGLNVHHPELRQRLAGAGATLGNGALVRLPRAMVEQALGTAARRVVIHDRSGRPVMPLGPQQIYFGTGSDLINMRDLESGRRRPAVLDDVGRAARLCDALPEIDFVMSHVLPSDVPGVEAEPQQYYAMLKNTTKPVIMTSWSGRETFARMHEMACLAAGGEAAFRARPNYIMYGQFISPLQHDRPSLETLLFCAEQEVPLIYVATILPGASGPVTLAGSLALSAAEFLAGLVMHQTVRPGAPFICGACVSRLDWHTMLFPYGSPEWRLNDLAMAELARHYELPVFGTGGATDSKVLDAQAGAEYAGSLLVAALAGANLIHDVGYLESGLTGSLESILLGAEQIRWVKQFLAGLAVTPEALALDVIQEVGPAGDFMGVPHTAQHFRETLWKPYALTHDSHESWVAQGGKDYAAAARERTAELLREHEPAPLDPATDAKLRQLCGLTRAPS